MSNGKSGRKSKLGKIALVVVGVILLILFSKLGLIDYQPEGELTLTMIDVGQADSFLFVQNAR